MIRPPKKSLAPGNPAPTLPRRAKRTADSGTYILVMDLSKKAIIQPGALPPAEYPPGIYLYVGRARRGLSSRLARHFRQRKKIFWHIDYLLQRASLIDVWVSKDTDLECRTARRIPSLVKHIALVQKRFGASDCGCSAHLFYTRSGEGLETVRLALGFERSERWK